jgi:PKD repeat protein
MDKDGDTRTSVVYTHNVSNVAPTVGPINISPDPPVIEVGTSINASADFTDPSTADTHTAEWDWGDGIVKAGTVTQGEGTGSVSDSHLYMMPGVYMVKLIVWDDDEGQDEEIYQYVVVYDPEGGFVTGGGWINSPEGACAFDACKFDTTGKANFGFVSKYKKNAEVPTGNTEFQFKAGNLNFQSTIYQWLVVAGAKAMYKGEGTINGKDNYGFMISAVDENLTPSTDTDLFRIKIWDKGNGDFVVYDNQMGADEDEELDTSVAAIGGGSIVIHK